MSKAEPHVANTASAHTEEPHRPGRVRATTGWVKSIPQRTRLAAVIFLGTYLFPAIGLLRGPGPTYEEGIVLFGADLVSKGQVPHRDFFSIYGPLSTWIPGQVLRVVGPSTFAIRALGIIILGVLIWGIYRLAVSLRPGADWIPLVCLVAASVVLLSAQVVGPAAWWWGLTLVVWAALLSQRSADSSGHPFFAAMLAGLTSGFRPDLLPLAVLLVCVGVWPQLKAHAKAIFAGGLLGCVPLFLHAGTAGLSTVVNGLFVVPVVQLRPFRSLPVPPPFDHFDSTVMALMSSGTTGMFRVGVPAQFAMWFWLLVLAPVVLTAAIAFRTYPRRTVTAGSDGRRTFGDTVMGSPKWFGDLSPARRQWIILSFGLLPQLIQRADFAHMVLVGVVLVPALILGVAEAVPKRVALRSAVAVLIGLAVVVSPALLSERYFDALRFGPAKTAAVIRSGGREFFVASDVQAASFDTALRLVREDMTNDETIIVAPADISRSVLNDMILYYLIPELAPGTYFSEINPGISNDPDSGFRDDLRSADWLILTHFADSFREPNRSTERLDPELPKIVQESFCTVPENDPYIEVLHRCERP